MSSPLSFFRRNQKLLLAVFGVLIMLTFVVGDYISRYQSRSGAAAPEGAVVTWKHGKLYDRDLWALRDAHNLAIRFLDALVQETIKAKGQPRGLGVSVVGGRVIDPGIPRSYAEEDLVQTLILARKAEDLGVRISDGAVFEFLDTLSDDVIPREQFGVLLKEATGGRFGKAQLFEQLRTELLAQHMRFMAGSGVFAMSPGLAWDAFNRLNRAVKTELLPLPAEDFKSKVTAQPTEAEVSALYEEGKSRYAAPDAAEPGFKRRRKIAFQYLKADFEKYLQQEMAALTQEQVAEYYEKNKGDFKVPESPPAEEKKPAGKPEAGAGDAAPKQPPADLEKPEAKPTEAKPEAKPAEAKPAKPKPEPAKPAETKPEPAKPTDAKPADDKPAPAKPTDAKPEPAKPAEAPSTKPATTPEPTPKEKESAAKEVELNLDPPASKDAPAKAGESKQSRNRTSPPPAAFVFVSYNAGETAEEAPQEAAKEAPKEEPKEAKKDAAAKEPPKDAPAAKSETPPAPKADVKPPAPPAGQEKPPAAPPVAAPPESASAKPEEKKDEPPAKYKPLAEVEQEIRRNLARAPAQDKVTAALNNARNELRKYFQAHASWRANSKTKPDLPEPTPPDVQELGEKHGLIGGEIPLVDELQIGDYELGKAYRFSLAGNQFRRESFAEIAYTDRLPLYQTDQIRSFEVDVEFLYWKTKETEPFVPPLEDIRDEVVDAWKSQEAFQLAKAEAEKLAKATKGDKPLKESLDPDMAKRLLEPPAFTWLTHGAMPMGSGAPMLNVVEGVEHAGQEFMQAVFRLKTGEVGVAVNTPHTVAYVVRLASESPPEEQRRTQFVEGGLTGDMGFLARVELQGFLSQWHRDLEKEMQVKWSRPPEVPRQIE